MKNLVRLLSLSTCVLVLSACNLIKPSTSSSASTSASSSTTTDTSETTTTGEPPKNSCTLYLSGEALPFDNSGIHIDDESGAANKDMLITSLNGQVVAQFVTSLSASNCNISTDNSHVSQETLHFTIGSSASSGYVEFTFSKKIKKVIATCIAYYKETYSIDTDSTVVIDGESHSISNDPTASKQEPHSFEKVYSTGQSKVKLSNMSGSQRFFLESIQLFYD